MANFKKKIKSFGRYVWELFKSSILPSIMYACAGWLLMGITLNGTPVTWTDKKLLWSVCCALGAALYQVFTAWVSGGNQYEMLVSGNVKRSSSAAGNEYQISSHKLAKEYRPWKGFLIGGFTAIVPALVGFILGCSGKAAHVETMSKALTLLVLFSFFVGGWATIPFYVANQAGYYVSYFWILPVSLLPVVIGGVMYIVGAYSRRNKNMRLRIIADKQAEAEAAKRANPKINYGGLPGTKPKKRK